MSCQSEEFCDKGLTNAQVAIKIPRHKQLDISDILPHAPTADFATPIVMDLGWWAERHRNYPGEESSLGKSHSWIRRWTQQYV